VARSLKNGHRQSHKNSSKTRQLKLIEDLFMLSH